MYNSLYIFIFIILSLSRPAFAQVTAPSNGGEVSLIRVTATTMELRFGMTGTGQGRVVMMAAVAGNTSVSLAASNGILYSANSVYGQGSPIGSGYVIYCGNGHSAVVTGLVPSTAYYITTAEFNQDSNTILYNTHSSSVSTYTRAAAILASQSSVARDVEIYPNPSVGRSVQLNLRGYSGAKCYLSLTDALGQQVVSQLLIPTETAYLIPLALPQNLVSGSYLLTLIVGNDSPIRKQLIITN